METNLSTNSPDHLEPGGFRGSTVVQNLELIVFMPFQGFWKLL